MELQLECPFLVRVTLATFPPITLCARMKGFVGISLGLPSGIHHGYQKKKKSSNVKLELHVRVNIVYLLRAISPSH